MVCELVGICIPVNHRSRPQGLQFLQEPKQEENESISALCEGIAIVEMVEGVA